jgi:hypothetical protein
MNPANLALMIPILALCIPIVAILANAAKKRNLANPAQEKRIRDLELKVKLLEQQAAVLSDSVLQMEEKQEFMTKLLEDK